MDTVAAAAKAKPPHCADRRKQHAFGQQLADQTPPAGAQRQPQADLALPCHGARQHQVGDVGARDEEHHAHQDRQHRHKANGETVQATGQSAGIAEADRVARLLAFAVRVIQAFLDHVQCGGRLFPADARLEPPVQH
jgi:hypothetical protein